MVNTQWFGVYARKEESRSTQDGFLMDIRSLADRLIRAGIGSLPGKDGREMPCENFYDDWHVYAVNCEGETAHGLVKLREQEHDAALGLYADGDAPGVTVSFVGFDVEKLILCLQKRDAETRSALAREITRVVSVRGEMHDELLKRYFVRPQAQGAYCIAEQYIAHAASFARNGRLELPLLYRKGCGGRRIARFMRENERAAGRMICDGESILLQDATNLTVQEKYAVLAAHTANTSLNSFAAEVRMHAQFLLPLMRVRLLGHSLYDSALRADMTIDNARAMSFAPYYHEASLCVRRQAKEHGKR